MCRGTKEVIPLNHLIIEPQGPDVFMYYLSDFPVNVTIQNSTYIISSAIMYINNGHFVSYCRRSNGIWELYDDLKRKVSNVTRLEDVKL